MSLIIPCRGFKPIIGEDCFIAPNASIIGEVEMGKNVSIWFGAIIRGDVNSIKIGNYSNIQDGVVIHGTYEKASTHIGEYVSIGHSSIIHGCTIHNHVLVGMGSIIMDGCKIEPYCIIGAGSLVLENSNFESGYIYAGSPAKKIKMISDQQRELLNKLPHNYVMYSSWFKDLE